MAKNHGTFSTQSHSAVAAYYRSLRNNPMTFLTVQGKLAHDIGWIWGMLGSGDDTSERKQGVKLPSSYVIMGNIEEVWDGK